VYIWFCKVWVCVYVGFLICVCVCGCICVICNEWLFVREVVVMLVLCI